MFRPHPSPLQQRRVHVGDKIVAVNGVRGSAKDIIEECKVSNHLRLTVMRPFGSSLPCCCADDGDL